MCVCVHMHVCVWSWFLCARTRVCVCVCVCVCVRVCAFVRVHARGSCSSLLGLRRPSSIPVALIRDGLGIVMCVEVVEICLQGA